MLNIARFNEVKYSFVRWVNYRRCECKFVPANIKYMWNIVLNVFDKTTAIIHVSSKSCGRSVNMNFYEILIIIYETMNIKL